MYELKPCVTCHNIFIDDVLIGTINFEVLRYILHINDLNILEEYRKVHHATRLLMQLVEQFDIDIIEGIGTFEQGEFFWERLGAEMSEYRYSIESTPKHTCLGRNFKLSRGALLKYDRISFKAKKGFTFTTEQGTNYVSYWNSLDWNWSFVDLDSNDLDHNCSKDDWYNAKEYIIKNS